MHPTEARQRIVVLSLATTVVAAGFLIISPLLIQLETQDAYRVVQIIFPVFAGYLGSAVLFLFQRRAGRTRVQDPQLLRYLVLGPFFIFWFLGIVLFIFFWASNLPGGIPGMSVDQLSNYVTMLVSFMNVTVGALTSFLFNAEEQAAKG